ncbi:MAG: amidohydrolase family protein, partial [Flavobacteriaceae bacterium]|nr:amidohydrolase family protein [Flavobacteriaceae bacterium]
MKKSIAFILFTILISCTSEKIQVDLIVTNAKIYTVNEGFEMAEAFAVKEGKIVAVGTSESILLKYIAEEHLNAEGKTILPGLIDAHAHLYNFGMSLQNVNLVGTLSKEEALQKIVDFQ